MKRYLHFTDQAGAADIGKSGVIWKSSYGASNTVFAVIEGGAWVPSVQMSSMGRVPVRSHVVVFTTDFLPDRVFPEEAKWALEELPINVLEIISPAEAKKILDSSVEEDDEFDLLKVPHHPAFNDFGEWTRMPEDFMPWVPGVDNEKYKRAHKLWNKTKSIQQVRNFWHNNNLEEKIRFFVEQVLDTKLPVSKGEEWDVSTASPKAIEVEDEVFDMIDQSYKNLGGHVKIKSPKDVRKYPYEVLADIDKDPDPDSVIMYKKSAVGDKIALLASDGTAQGKQKAFEILKNKLENGAWLEVSGPIAHILINKMNVVPVTDKEKVEALLKDKEITWHGYHPTEKDRWKNVYGWYSREIAGEPHTKILIGKV